MKKIFFFFSTVIILLISATTSKSQQPGKPLPPARQVDINVDNFTATVTRFPCEQNKLNITFSIRNKRPITCSIRLTYKVNHVEENFTVTSPASAGNIEIGDQQKPYYKININQTAIFQANIDVKESWVQQGGNIPVSVKAEVVNPNPGEIRFSEDITLLGDNQKETHISFTGVPLLKKNYCICNIPGLLIDTASKYIVRGNVKPPNATSPIHSGTMAMSNLQFGLKVMIMQNDAARIKFIVAGYRDEAHAIPLYYIKFEASDMFMTMDNPGTGDIYFSNLNGGSNQKWILKPNPNGSYGIFNAGPTNQLKCYALGKPFNLPPAIGSVLKCDASYDATNVYQQFYLVKLQN